MRHLVQQCVEPPLGIRSAIGAVAGDKCIGASRSAVAVNEGISPQKNSELGIPIAKVVLFIMENRQHPPGNRFGVKIWLGEPVYAEAILLHRMHHSGVIEGYHNLP